ncbi:glycosyltransferase family 4 protein, partial [Romboutsia sp. Marseille-P6047]|uniref:glycosyltransferase family 4 protein n=1 Tax=Romboutsia sp. Marseille-P6047 TaxID=2161817 RepID=UPI0013DE6ABF
NIEDVNHKYMFLKSRTIRIKGKLDYKYIHIPINILKKLDEIKPDIIIGSEYNPTVLLAYSWSKVKNKKFISWSDGTLNSEKNITLIQQKLRKIICSGSHALIASSTKTKEAQLYYGAKSKIFLSYLTIDINKYICENEYNKNNNIIFVGTLSQRKGIDLLFEALKDVNINYKLKLIGSGEDENKLRNLSIKLGIDKKVEFLGFKQREELVNLYKNSNLFVLPSRQDCFGLVINEAMCAGLPVIVSKYADGSYDLIDQGKGGYIIDPLDTEQFKKTIEYMLTNHNKIKTMGMYNKNKILLFDIENVAKEYLNAIDYV